MADAQTRICRRAFIAAAAALAAAPGHAQAGSLRIVAPFPPGGSTDILARLLAERFGQSLQQPAIVDNKPGANGALGTDFVARARPDGQTLLVTTNATVAINPLLHKTPLDPAQALAPVLQLVELELVLAVRADLPAKSFEEFLALARSRKDGLTFASVGAGSLSHLAGEAFRGAAGVPMLHVPYKGAAPALADLLSGQVDCYFGTPPTFLQHVRTGRLRVLASTGSQPSPWFERLPRVADRFPGFDVVGWQGLFAPTGTPRPMLDKLAQLAAALLQEEPVRAKLAEQGMRVTGWAGAELAASIQRERAYWSRLIAEHRITA